MSSMAGTPGKVPEASTRVMRVIRAMITRIRWAASMARSIH